MLPGGAVRRGPVLFERTQFGTVLGGRLYELLLVYVPATCSRNVVVLVSDGEGPGGGGGLKSLQHGGGPAASKCVY